MKQKNILTIAGFDPSAGAGILADTKTITTLKSYSLSVCTANTIQTDMSFEQCDWVSVSFIQKQLSCLLKRFRIHAIKIGIVENTAVLQEIIALIRYHQANVKIVLDPVLRATTDFEFHDTNKKMFVEPSLLKEIEVITPNLQEISKLSSLEGSAQIQAQELQQYTHVLLKGGHSLESSTLGVDYLFTKEGKKFTLNPKKKARCFSKHGSGCILSSALATYLAQGYPLLKACLKAKRYTEQRLASSKGLLALH